MLKVHIDHNCTKIEATGTALDILAETAMLIESVAGKLPPAIKPIMKSVFVEAVDEGFKNKGE